jgi:hypothetical protein
MIHMCLRVYVRLSKGGMDGVKELDLFSFLVGL